jgi:hypothetical protein
MGFGLEGALFDSYFLSGVVFRLDKHWLGDGSEAKLGDGDHMQGIRYRRSAEVA